MIWSSPKTTSISDISKSSAGISEICTADVVSFEETLRLLYVVMPGIRLLNRDTEAEVKVLDDRLSLYTGTVGRSRYPDTGIFSLDFRELKNEREGLF